VPISSFTPKAIDNFITKSTVQNIKEPWMSDASFLLNNGKNGF